MPASFDEEHSGVEYKKELQHRYGPRGAANDNTYHAHDVSDLVDNDVEKYLRAASSVVDGHLKGQDIPLIISGTANRIGAIRKMLGYTLVLQTPLEGNYQNTNTQELFNLTSPISQQYYQAEHHTKIQQVLDAHPDHIATTDKELEAAAVNGRIDTLLVPCYSYTSDGNSTGYGKQIVFDENIFAPEIEKLCRDVLSFGGAVLATDRSSTRLSQPIALCRY